MEGKACTLPRSFWKLGPLFPLADGSCVHTKSPGKLEFPGDLLYRIGNAAGVSFANDFATTPEELPSMRANPFSRPTAAFIRELCHGAETQDYLL